MADAIDIPIKVLRTTGTGPPAEGLDFGELAFSDGDNTLYVGKNDGTIASIQLTAPDPPPPDPPPGGGYDSDAQAIITAVESADGQALETVVTDALNQFVLDLKTANIYTPLAAGTWRLLAGPRTLAGILACGQGGAPTNNNFVAGDYTRAIGLKGDGTTKTISTGYSIGGLSKSDHHLAVWISEISGAGAMFHAGTVTDPRLAIRYNSPAMNFWSGTATSRFDVSEIPQNPGLKGLDRRDLAGYDVRTGGTTTPNTETETAGTMSGDTLIIFDNGSGLYSDARQAWYSAGGSLGAGGLAALDTALATYLAAISGVT